MKGQRSRLALTLKTVYLDLVLKTGITAEIQKLPAYRLGNKTDRQGLTAAPSLLFDRAHVAEEARWWCLGFGLRTPLREGALATLANLRLLTSQPDMLVSSMGPRDLGLSGQTGSCCPFYQVSVSAGTFIKINSPLERRSQLLAEARQGYCSGSRSEGQRLEALHCLLLMVTSPVE